MSKLISKIFILVAICFSLAWVSITTVGAQIVGCTEWQCEFWTDPLTGGTSQTCFCVNEPEYEWSCGAGEYVCNGGCCDIGTGTPPPGGGGTCDADFVVNCPAGSEGQTTEVINSQCISNRAACTNGDGSIRVGTAQGVGSCCGEKTTPEGDVVCTHNYVYTYRCCPSGTTSSCSNVPVQFYSESCWGNGVCFYQTTPGVAGYSVGRLISSAGTSEKCGGKGDDTQYYVRNLCERMEWQCNCVSCTATAPSVPTLLLPANGATLATLQTSLMWNNISQTWGAGCPSNTNQFEIYIGSAPTNLALMGTVGSGTGSVTFNGSSGQTYYWKIRAKNGSANTDSATWSFTMTLPNTDPWWQVKDGDVTTNGDITSLVPSAELFNTVGLGGYPGVPVFGGIFNLSGTPARVSTTVWNVNSNTSLSRLFNYSYFENLVPDGVNFNNISNLSSGGSAYSDSYHWFKATGNTTINSDVNIGNRKVILFVENGNLTINGRVNLNDGNGFFGAFVEGNITIENSVAGSPSLEGVYLSNGSFNTGAGTSQLHIRGSVASYGGINLQRDLSNNSTPAELFEFAPDQMMLFPEKLMFRRNKWTEVAP